MNPKYSIKVHHSEKELYRIFKDLEKYGHTTFEYDNPKKQQGIARSIGIRGKPLVDNGFLVPPLSSTNKHKMTGIMLRPNIKCIEKSHRFYFQRKK